MRYHLTQRRTARRERAFLAASTIAALAVVGALALVSAPAATAGQVGGGFTVTGSSASTTFPSGLGARFSFTPGADGGLTSLKANPDIGNAFGPTGNRAGVEPLFVPPAHVLDQWFDMGDVTVSFSRPVTNPRLNLVRPKFESATDGPGGKVWTSAEMRFTVTSGNARITPLGTAFAGYYDVSPDGLVATPVRSVVSRDPNSHSSMTSTVELTGTFSSVTLHLDKRNRISTTGDAGPATYYDASMPMAVSVDEDFGSAPASYGDASHVMGGLYLGGKPAPANVNGLSTTAGVNAADVADAIGAWPTIGTGRRGKTVELDVPVANPLDGPASVSGWIDFNGNHTFDSGEEATGTTSAQGASVVHLTWTVPADVKAGPTWARLRVVAGDAPVGPSGMADSGEVEDYRLEIDATTADISVMKTGPASAQVGDDVTWTVVVSNGDAAGTPPTDARVEGAVMTDAVPAAFTDVSWTCVASPGSACVDAAGTGNAISARSDLAIGGSATYTITGTLTDQPGTNAFTNVARGDLPPGTELVDPNPDDNESSTTGQTPALRITKTVDSAEASSGDRVGYVITVTNPTDVEYSAALLHDDLSAVLDDATLDAGSLDPSTGVVQLGDGQLDWLFDLAPHATATLRYTVVVDDPDRGDRRLINTVVADASTSGSNCAPGATDAACSTSTEVVDHQVKSDPGPGAGGLAFTGSDDLVLAAGALVLVVAGVMVLVGVRRRNRRA